MSAGNARANLRGILSMLAAMACFTTNDMFVKLSSDYFGTAQTIFVRGLFATALVLVIAYARGALTPLPRTGWTAISMRTLGETGAALLVIAALFHMPFANVMAVLLALPLVMTVISALLFGEAVRARRWAAVVAGFVGMLLVVQPAGEGFTIYSILVMAGLASLALRDSASRYLPEGVNSLFVAAVAAVVVTAVSGLWALGEPWTPVSARPLIYLACAAAGLIAGIFFITEAMRNGDVSVVAPFFYSTIIWALIYGVAIWGDVPGAPAFAGIVLIVGSGLYVLHREARPHGGGDRAHQTTAGAP
jgi:drug/metabolite transporter (DMT)-like permease